MIKTLKLNNFRQFKKEEFDLNSNLVIITADNTKGKSTILEAIYLLTNQTSPFTSKNEDLIKSELSSPTILTEGPNSNHFRLECTYQYNDGSTRKLALFNDSTKKQYFRDTHSTTRKKFSEGIASTLFSPEQIEILMNSSAKRREYLNSLLSKVDPEYGDQLLRFHKVLRQRNAYLKRLAKRFYSNGEINLEDTQLHYWSETFVQASAELSEKRAALIEELKSDHFFIRFEPSIKYPYITQPSDIEKKQNLTELYSVTLEKLVDNLRRDIATGHTSSGAHRDDWSIHSDKDIKKFGSRGEKRMAISRMIFRNQEILAEKLGYYPILLLDDIGSELDHKNTEKILRDSLRDNQQLIMTTITLDHIPEEFIKAALIIKL